MREWGGEKWDEIEGMENVGERALDTTCKRDRETEREIQRQRDAKQRVRENER